MSSTIVSFEVEKAKRESRQIRANLRKLAARMAPDNPLKGISLAIAAGDLDLTDALLAALQR